MTDSVEYCEGKVKKKSFIMKCWKETEILNLKAVGVLNKMTTYLLHNGSAS